jgi:hypothetical protein
MALTYPLVRILLANSRARYESPDISAKSLRHTARSSQKMGLEVSSPTVSCQEGATRHSMSSAACEHAAPYHF